MIFKFPRPHLKKKKLCSFNFQITSFSFAIFCLFLFVAFKDFVKLFLLEISFLILLFLLFLLGLGSSTLAQVFICILVDFRQFTDFVLFRTLLGSFASFLGLLVLFGLFSLGIGLGSQMGSFTASAQVEGQEALQHVDLEGDNGGQSGYSDDEAHRLVVGQTEPKGRNGQDDGSKASDDKQNVPNGEC